MTDALASRAALSRTAVAAPQSEPHVTRALRCRQWPGVTDEVAPPHAGLRLYGAAAFERCLQVAPHALEPSLTQPVNPPSSDCPRARHAASCHRHVVACAPGRGRPALLRARAGPGAQLCVCRGGRSSSRRPRCWASRPVRAPALQSWSAHVCSAWMAAVTAALYARRRPHAMCSVHACRARFNAFFFLRTRAWA